MKTTNAKREKSNATRSRLLGVADTLFRRYGFDDTTLESISKEAGFHVQTLIRHFRTKNDLMLALLDKDVAEFTDFMQTREKSALSRWRDWVEFNAARTDPVEPLAIAEVADYWHRYEATLAQEIGQDMGVDSRKDLRPLLAACMLVGANKHTAHEMTSSGRTKNWVADMLNVVDVAVEHLSLSLGLNKQPNVNLSRTKSI